MARVRSLVSGRRSMSAARSPVTQPRPELAAQAVNDRMAERCRFQVRGAAPSHGAVKVPGRVRGSAPRPGVASPSSRRSRGMVWAQERSVSGSRSRRARNAAAASPRVAPGAMTAAVTAA
jgi:hypothetical protein